MLLLNKINTLLNDIKNLLYYLSLKHDSKKSSYLVSTTEKIFSKHLTGKNHLPQHADRIILEYLKLFEYGPVKL